MSQNQQAALPEVGRPSVDAVEALQPRSRGGLGRRLAADPAFFLPIAVALLVSAAALGAPLISGDPNFADPAVRFQGPGFNEHWLGTDHLGRDMWARVVWGARSSLVIAIVPVLFGSVMGLLIGLVAGFVGGLADETLMRLTDALLAIPPLLFAIAALVALEPSATSIIFVLTVLMVPGAARIVRGNVLSLKQRDYIEAARAIGGTGPRIMAFHILPNALAPLVVYSSLGIANMLLLSAGISFLGLGPQPPSVDWGSMIAEGHSFLRTAPHMVYVPGFSIFLATMIVNLAGDSLQDAMDPKREGILL